jgi:3,4-dihydroxy 2-butanone 4-phosphate synthase/GTP cyclohydrolase II
MDTKMNSIREAIDAIKAGRPIIVVDDLDRENEGDIILPASHADASAINFMASEARGLICVAMTGEALDRLKIPMMVSAPDPKSLYNSPFTVSVEASEGVTTGISAADRARTIQVLVDPSSGPEDVTMPGHMFPLRAQPEGVLARRGHTEAGVDLMRLAGLPEAAVICEIMNDDGTMARRDDLELFSRKHDLLMVTIDDLVAYRKGSTGTARVERIDTARLPTKHGLFEVTAYVDQAGQEHLALSMGRGLSSQDVLVRLHSECLTGDVLGSLRCDCGQQLDRAMAQIANEGAGMILYLRQEGRGIGLVNKIRAYALQDGGMDTVEANLSLGYGADQRDYAVAAAILIERSIKRVRLMTNNPKKIADLTENGIHVVERVPLEIPPHPENQHYLRTKRDKMDHSLSSL